MPELPELVEWQLLAGLQLVIEPYALITPLDLLASAWAHVARSGVSSIAELSELSELPGSYQSLRAIEVAIAGSTAYSAGSSGNATPFATVDGPSTGLSAPNGLAVAPPLSVRTTHLPTGHRRHRYETVLRANLGTTPYHWRLSRGEPATQARRQAGRTPPASRGLLVHRFGQRLLAPCDDRQSSTAARDPVGGAVCASASPGSRGRQRSARASDRGHRAAPDRGRPGGVDDPADRSCRRRR